MDSSTLVAVIAVIVSGVVAVAAQVAQPLIQKRNEDAKWKRDRRSADESSISKAAIEVLTALAVIKSGNFISADYNTRRGGDQTDEVVFSRFLSHFYAWEISVSPFLNDLDRGNLFVFRRLMEGQNVKLLSDNATDHSHEIHNYTEKARKRLSE